MALSIHNSDSDTGLDTDTSLFWETRGLETRWAAGRWPSGHPGTQVCDNHPVEFSRDHKVPASVCSQSDKHSMGVGGLRDKGGVVGPRLSWSENTGETPAGLFRLPFWNHQLFALSSVDQESGWEGSSTQREPPPPLHGTPASRLGRTPRTI